MCNRHSLVFILLLLSFILLAHADECMPHWTRRSSSSVQIQFKEYGPNNYRPVAVLFTPNRPVPENLTEIMILPASASSPSLGGMCTGKECDPSGDFDLVFFTKSIGRHFIQSEIDLVQCEDVESCQVESIPEPNSLLTLPSFLNVPTLLPTTTGPSSHPSFQPSVGPSVQPTQNPSTAPSVDPSQGPTTDMPSLRPTAFPVVKFRLMVEERILWKQQNIHLLKNLFSTMYEIPFDVIQLSTVSQSDEHDGVDVEFEIRDHQARQVDVSFEDQVFITGRLKHSSVLEGEGDISLVPLDILKHSRQFMDLQEIICGSISEHFHDIKVREVKQFGSQFHLTVEATLQLNQLSFELGELEYLPVHRRTMILPIAKRELFSLDGISRLKVALSKRLPGVEKNDIKVISLDDETDSSTSVEMDISTKNPNILDHLTHEDEVFIVEHVLTKPTKPENVIAIGAIVLVMAIGGFLMWKRKKDNGLFLPIHNDDVDREYVNIDEHHVAEPGELHLARAAPDEKQGDGDDYRIMRNGDLGHMWHQTPVREGEASDVSEGEEHEEGMMAEETPDLVLSPVVHNVDHEMETGPVTIRMEPMVVISSIIARLTDDET